LTEIHPNTQSRFPRRVQEKLIRKGKEEKAPNFRTENGGEDLMTEMGAEMPNFPGKELSSKKKKGRGKKRRDQVA